MMTTAELASGPDAAVHPAASSHPATPSDADVPSGEQPLPPARRRARLPVLGVRSRVLGTVVVLSALAMLVSAFVTYTVLDSRLGNRVDQQISQEIREFSALVADGVDPRTGQPLSQAPVDRLFRVALQRNVPDGSEVLFAVYDTRTLHLNTTTAPIYEDPVLLAQVRAVESPVYGDYASVDGPVRYGAYPVLRDGGVGGVFVVAAFTGGERRELRDAMVVLALTSTLALGLIALLGWRVAGRLLAPVRLVRQTAQRISDTDFTGRIPVRGNDDISQVARTFNDMLDRLQQAFVTQRSFLDDVGHELRTPITIVQGHLETADLADPVERAETRALVLDELERMSHLVEDLTVLAKSERPDFLRSEELSLHRLVEDVADRTRALGDREWALDLRAEASFPGDRHRLTQALVQLAHNSVKHTGPGDRIVLGADAVDDRVHLWVTDEGSGIAPADLDRIFERFQRGHGGRGREGSGLGLAIVRAIAQAHGGRVGVRSIPGEGATFTLDLPGRPGDDGDGDDGYDVPGPVAVEQR